MDLGRARRRGGSLNLTRFSEKSTNCYIESNFKKSFPRVEKKKHWIIFQWLEKCGFSRMIEHKMKMLKKLKVLFTLHEFPMIWNLDSGFLTAYSDWKSKNWNSALEIHIKWTRIFSWFGSSIIIGCLHLKIWNIFVTWCKKWAII